LRELSSGAGIDRDDRPVLEYATASMGDAFAGSCRSANCARTSTPPKPCSLTERPRTGRRRRRAVRERNLGDIAAAAELRDVEPLRRVADYGVPGAEGALRANPENAEAQRIAGDALVLLAASARRCPMRARRWRCVPTMASRRGLAVALLASAGG
jgi:hypothetical protein